MHVNANIYRLSINQHENASVSATEHKSACKCDYTNASMPATEHKSASKREHAKTEYKSACKYEYANTTGMQGSLTLVEPEPGRLVESRVFIEN